MSQKATKQKKNQDALATGASSGIIIQAKHWMDDDARDTSGCPTGSAPHEVDRVNLMLHRRKCQLHRAHATLKCSQIL
jgi:hypothetical protein